MRLPVRLLLAATLAANAAPAAAHEPLSETIERLDGRIIVDPTASDWIARAIANIEAGRPREALDDLDQAAALGGGPGVDLERAVAWFALARMEEARAAIDAYIASAGADTRSLLLRARIREEVGDADGAIDDSRAAIADGNSVEAYDLAGRLLARGGSVDEATDTFVAGWERTGSTALLVRGFESALIAGRADLALALAAAGENAARVDTRWLLRRRQALLLVGRADEAQEVAQAAVVEARRALDGRGSCANQLDLARALVATGDRVAGVELADAALARCAADPDVRRTHAEIAGGNR